MMEQKDNSNLGLNFKKFIIKELGEFNRIKERSNTIFNECDIPDPIFKKFDAGYFINSHAMFNELTYNRFIDFLKSSEDNYFYLFSRNIKDYEFVDYLKTINEEGVINSKYLMMLKIPVNSNYLLFNQIENFFRYSLLDAYIIGDTDSWGVCSLAPARKN